MLPSLDKNHHHCRRQGTDLCYDHQGIIIISIIIIKGKSRSLDFRLLMRANYSFQHCSYLTFFSTSPILGWIFSLHNKHIDCNTIYIFFTNMQKFLTKSKMYNVHQNISISHKSKQFLPSKWIFTTSTTGEAGDKYEVSCSACRPKPKTSFQFLWRQRARKRQAIGCFII